MVRPRVREDNLLAITLEKVRAGVVPIPADSFIDNITAHARHQGLEIHWEREGDLPVAVIRFTPDPRNSKDVVLEQVQVLNGRILLEGRSSRSRGMMACPVLPTRKLLQSAFPKRRVQAKGVSASPRHSIRRKSTTPMS